ncbi:TonB-dependent receptor [Hymenobacter cheonanensis]|uniref:TonB-dependent receptor n=1 Tax=Hymenobacter sp. CA2-7 TaxID=3063993 RepID=UPI0027128B29|nr:TonB-dependent receptor [Hymenobacter sp. CA2-7]MDO7886627.1 TonB-dependent receptor [Hymenobacter sp. CA2-7]
MRGIFMGAGLAVASLVSAQAQQAAVRGTILDAQSQQPLPGVTVVAPGTGAGTTTDASGRFVLAAPADSRELTISFIGYNTQRVRVPATGHALTVRLEAAPVSLQGVVVSGSREQERRTETPVAISQISPQLIADTKATAPYQLLNKVAGVYMVDLGAEQHMMAIRQPITTNAVYLYLEDGLPIRPIGIFNHNALYEINQAGVRSVEVVKGPSSSLYGSNAIGGAVNFLTKQPTPLPTVGASVQGDNFGYRRVDASASGTVGRLGLYAGGYAARQRGGWQDYTDFNKQSWTLRADYTFNAKTRLIGTGSYNYLYTQTPGTLDSAHFYSRTYQSNNRFTNREVTAVRGSLRLEHDWSPSQQTALTAFTRYNSTGQLPSYYIADVRVNGVYQSSTGQVNNQSFHSYGALVQHRADLGFLNSRLILGGYFDYSPSTYYARFLTIQKDVANNFYTGYTDTGRYLDDYKINLSNVAGYAQYEVQATEALRLVGGLRYDRVQYKFSNNLSGAQTSKKASQDNVYNIVAPKLGLTYALGPAQGLYANFSTGFQPPETGSLYSSRQTIELKQANFTNYEAGGWVALFERKVYIDLSLYQMEGRNEIVSLLQADNTTQSENVGATRHQGVEYTLTYAPVPEVNFRLSGTNARHTYLDYSEVVQGRNRDYAGNRMVGAPNWLANAEIFYKPRFAPGARLGLEYQRVGQFYTNTANTKTYAGYNLLNLRLGYRLPQAVARGLEVWANVVNLGNALYAVNATTNQYGTTYAAAAPRTVTLGLGYTFAAKARE